MFGGVQGLPCRDKISLLGTSHLWQSKTLHSSLHFTNGIVVDDELISHLMIPRAPGRSTFLPLGINGGHHDRFLHDFITTHPQLAIVKEAEKVMDGVVYRKYSQYWWKGSGPKPHPANGPHP
jgi:hypothetical protein